MYLFVWSDGQSRIVQDNITVGDMMSAKNGMLRVFKLRKGNYERLVFDEEKAYWVPIQEARTASSQDVKFHLP